MDLVYCSFYLSSRGEECWVWLGTILILASWEHLFIRIQKNLVQHPSINICLWYLSSLLIYLSNSVHFSFSFLFSFHLSVHKIRMRCKKKLKYLFTKFICVNLCVIFLCVFTTKQLPFFCSQIYTPIFWNVLEEFYHFT